MKWSHLEADNVKVLQTKRGHLLNFSCIKVRHSAAFRLEGQSSSSSSLCRRLLDLPFCVLFFLNDVGPPSSPRDVMMRSLNLCLGSGGRSDGAAAAVPSTWGNCKSTLALEEKQNGTVSALPTHVSGLDWDPKATCQYRPFKQHLLWILFLLDLFPEPIRICSFRPSGLRLPLRHLFRLLLLRFSCCALDLFLFFRLLCVLFRSIVTCFIVSLLFRGLRFRLPFLETK